MFDERGTLRGLDFACPLCDWGMSGVAPPLLHTLRLSPPICDGKRSMEAPLNDLWWGLGAAGQQRRGGRSLSGWDPVGREGRTSHKGEQIWQ